MEVATWVVAVATSGTLVVFCITLWVMARA